MLVRRHAIPLASLFLLVSSAAGAALHAETPRPQGWLGVGLAEVPPPQSDDENAPPKRGVLIGGVVAGSPAQKAGIRAHDRILMIDGAEISAPQEAISKLRAIDPGSWVSFTLDRRGQTKDMRVLIGTRPENADRLRMIEGWIGAEAIDLPPDLRTHFGAPKTSGVMISAVEDESPARAAGLELGDVVFEADGEPMTSTRMLAFVVRSAGVGNRIEIRLMRNGSEMTIEPLVEERPAKD